ncbi:MAG: 3-hydroxyacyl-CoA dehydrogenase/enoyl-CoA hydratase family protein [Deltaproteobacteria bacterium]|nr:3-hydroxyacyl-CoA dehydrogenase/enoyl-CoA hydratase family protein [Deltaproteobacteria bacterium]
MKRLNRTAVIGAGTMGSAIAQHFAMKGLEVQLVDLAHAPLERGMGLIAASLGEAKNRKLISEDEEKKILSRLSSTTDFSNISNCELVVEAVFEDRNVKKDVFRHLEKAVTPDCILATNTSSFLVSEVAEGLQHPSRVVGVHYFFHAAKNKLVEIVSARQSSKESVDLLYNFYYSIDKIPILTKDAPGFAVNRFFVPWLNEACRLYEEGKGSIAFIDEIACKCFGVGMGPFALMNATGVPIAEHAAAGLADRLGPSYAPAQILCDQVASRKDWDLKDTKVRAGGTNDAAVIEKRLVTATLEVASQMVDEGVTDAASADLGARVGLRWPKGPFEMMNDRDIRVHANPQWVRSRKIGSSGIIEFCMPDRMNPLSEETVAQLEKCWRDLDSDPAVETIFLTSRGKAFVAGADIKFFIQNIEKGDLNRIVQFTEKGQKLFSAISVSRRKVVAYLNGLTLGGGLELALACHIRIASPRAVLAFPETGIGIYPGLGGTQRAPRLIGKGLAKLLIATGQFIDAKTALQYGLVDSIAEISSPEELVQLRLPEAKAPGLSQNEMEQVFAPFDGMLAPNTFEQAPGLRAFEKALRRKAPKALRVAMALVDEGEKLPLDRALALELDHLKEIFSTKDALTGLKSILNQTKPEFTGG